jgi:predicted RNase H-like HicB family nuclease
MARLKKNFNYQVIIYPDKTEGGKDCFTAFSPALGIADYGETVEEAFKNIKSLIKFHLECLKKEKAQIPEDLVSEKANFITTAKVSIAL